MIKYNTIVVSLVGLDADQIERRQNVVFAKGERMTVRNKKAKKGGRGSRNSFDNGPIRGPIKERRSIASYYCDSFLFKKVFWAWDDMKLALKRFSPLTHTSHLKVF